VSLRKQSIKQWTETIKKNRNLWQTEQKLFVGVLGIKLQRTKKKVIKGVWRMPWLLEAMKDVISCDKLRGLANTI
jgi:hypothetical protein